MKITRKTNFFVERERRITIRFADRSVRPSRFCPDCQSDSLFVTVDEAALARQTTSREIFRLVEANQIHFNETADGLLLICLAPVTPVLEITKQT